MSDALARRGGRKRSGRKRGGPLAMLGTLVLVWVVFRAVSWTPPFDLPLRKLELSLPLRAPTLKTVPTLKPGLAQNQGRSLMLPSPHVAKAKMPQASMTGQTGDRFLASSLSRSEQLALSPPFMMGGHQILLMAGLTHLPVPQEVAALFRERAQGQTPAARGKWPLHPLGAARGKRLSFDGWVYLRSVASGRQATSAPLAATYGGSQAGAVIRYQLKPGNIHRPNAYIRATKALSKDGEEALALGLAARPLANVPVMANAEIRATRIGGATHVRPAGFVHTQLPPLELPVGLRAEAYGQAGYVGGPGKTVFIDGQLRADRELARFKLGDLRAGAGVWGGAQKGAARLDIGPSAAVGLKLGEAPARLSLDYRMRVAGDAEPDSGLAVTLATNF